MRPALRIGAVFACVAVLASCTALSSRPEPDSAPDADQLLLDEALAQVRRHYVEPVDSKLLVYQAIRGMIGGLDPHSSFLTPEEFKAIRATTNGAFGGVGVEVAWRDGELVIGAILAGTPAAASGLLVGDKIMAIDAVAVSGLAIDQVAALLRGKPGSTVALKVQRRSGPQPLVVELVRAQIHVASVYWLLIPDGIGYLRIERFQQRTDSDVVAAVEALQRQKGGLLKGLVLDLRDNPGGLFDQAAKVADLFIERGLIVSTQGRSAGSAMKIMAHQQGTIVAAPMVVLINEGTASAAEIVAAALQAHERAQVVGRRSYGKGSVQTLIALADGSGLRLTTASYYTPKGVSIQAHGVVPDVHVARHEQANAAAVPPADHRVNDKKTDSVADAELAQAIALLRSWSEIGTPLRRQSD